MKTKRFNLIVILCALSVIASYAKQVETEVIRIEDTTGSMEARWDRGVRQSQLTEGDFWIGYAYEKMDSDCHFHRGSYEKSLSQLLDLFPGGKRNREMGILFLINREKNRPYDARKIELTEMDNGIDLEGKSLVWLGKTDHLSSFELCKKAFGRMESPDLRGELILAIGTHPHSDASTAFLKEVITKDPSDEVREDAVFWLALHDPGSLDFLRNLAFKDRSEELRKKAVFAISQIPAPEAIDALIELARSTDSEVAKESVFWLGQMASKKATEHLKNLVWDEAETEIQTQAVFALSQQGGVDELIEIANTHPNPEVRKKAIFWLGQSKDKKAIEAIISIIRKNG